MTPEAAQIDMDVPKVIYGKTVFVPRQNHMGHVICILQLQNTSGVLIPALTIQVEVKAPVVSTRCYYTFTLVRRIGHERIRVYQLEVVPQNKISHRGNPDIAGPHEHFGDEAEPTKIMDAGVNCDEWAACLAWFERRINLHPFDLASPC